MARDPVVMLQQVPLFAGLEPDELEQIAEAMYERRFFAGDTLIQQGANDEDLVLLTGSERTDMLCYTMRPPDFRRVVETNSAIAWKVLTAMSGRLLGPLPETS